MVLTLLGNAEILPRCHWLGKEKKSHECDHVKAYAAKLCLFQSVYNELEVLLLLLVREFLH